MIILVLYIGNVKGIFVNPKSILRFE
jgi:hypothetical protein